MRHTLGLVACHVTEGESGRHPRLGLHCEGAGGFLKHKDCFVQCLRNKTISWVSDYDTQQPVEIVPVLQVVELPRQAYFGEKNRPNKECR